MAMKDYEISSYPLTEKEGDYDPELYEKAAQRQWEPIIPISLIP